MPKMRERKDLQCKYCDEIVKNVGDDANSVICWKCVSDSLRKFNEDPKNRKNNVQNNTGSSE